MEKIVFDWNDEKNNLLKNSERKISFEEIVFAIKDWKLLDIIPSPTHENQKCFVVEVNDYVYIVPYVEANNEYFLKTIYPSRKHTKYYLK